MPPVLYLVIPCYNEQEVLPITGPAVLDKLKQLIAQGRISPDSRALFVDDGSRDGTWPLLQQMCREQPLLGCLKLSRNVGHQKAVLAGLMTARQYCDAAISMDADLQDDIDAIDQFLQKFQEGCEVVYGVRNRRDTDTSFKRRTARLFYTIMNRLGAETVYDHADFRLMSKRALDALAEFKEVNLFLRGIVPLIGFRSDYVYYDRRERAAGETKYPLRKMVGLAVDGITSFSVKPLRIIAGLGIGIAGLSVLGLLYALLSKLFFNAVAGWTAIISAIFLLGGIQLLCIGVCGEYIGKIYQEVKARPRYLIEEMQLTLGQNNPPEKEEQQ